jgi:hypothetical protein
MKRLIRARVGMRAAKGRSKAEMEEVSSQIAPHEMVKLKAKWLKKQQALPKP